MHIPAPLIEKTQKKIGARISRRFGNKSGGNKCIAQPKSERRQENAREKTRELKREKREKKFCWQAAFALGRRICFSQKRKAEHWKEKVESFAESFKILAKKIEVKVEIIVFKS